MTILDATIVSVKHRSANGGQTMGLLIMLGALTPPPAPHDGAAESSDRSLAGSALQSPEACLPLYQDLAIG